MIILKYLKLAEIGVFDFYVVILIIQALFIFYHIVSSQLIKSEFNNLILLIGVSLLVFSVEFFAFIREINLLINKLNLMSDGKYMFFWEGDSGLKRIVFCLSTHMTIIFINLIIALILLFFKSNLTKINAKDKFLQENVNGNKE